MSMNLFKVILLSSLVVICHSVTLQSINLLLDKSHLNTPTTPKPREKRQNSEEDDPDLECDFGQNDDLTICNWAHPFNASARFSWIVNRGSRYLLLGGPSVDRSSGDQDGGYAFYETSLYNTGSLDLDKLSGDNALLYSPNISRTQPEGFCLTFYYSIDGMSADRLNVFLYRQADESRIHLWESGDMGVDIWQKGEVVYTAGDRHQLVFEALPKKPKDPDRYFRGHVAIDDIRMDEVESDSDYCVGHCTFEGGFCGWVNNDEEEEDDFDWQLSRGSQSYLTGPRRDSVSFNKDIPTGGYSSIENAKPRNPGDKAELISPSMPETGDNNPVCMKFATHMFGNGVGTLRVRQKYQDSDDNDVERIIWEIGGDAGNHWYMAQVTVSSPSPHKLVFEGVVGKNTMGSIAIDNISFRPGTCPIYPQTAFEMSADCSFEENVCNWNNPTPHAGVDDFDWNRIQNYAQLQSLPLIDHTTGKSEGFYLTLTNTSPLPLRGGTRAWLVSPTITLTQIPKCIEFYYYMFERTIDTSGPSLGSLRVYVRPSDPERSHQLTSVWRLNNHQRRQWLRARAVIVMGLDKAPPSENYQVIIEGLWGHGGVGTIAIDDISFFDGACTNHPAEGTPIRGECFFDKDTCDWMDRTIAPPTHEYGEGERGATVRWRLASTISRPANVLDRTFGGTTGFVFFDVFNQPRVQKPILRSPSLKNDGSGVRCFSFWFALFGRGVDTTLSVHLVDLSEAESEKVTLLWKIDSKDKKPVEWTYAQVTVETEEEYSLQLTGESSDGGFAIDDITFNDVKCKLRPESATPVETDTDEE